MRLGFIGLGVMGRPMAANLQRGGHEVQAYDLRRVEGFPNWKASAAEAVRGCEVVFTSLPGPKEVQAIAGEIRAALPSGASWFDLSTNSPEVVRRLHGELPQIHFLDAPVSGGPTGAESGKLALWIGGEQAIFQKYLQILKTIGDQPLYVGPIGAGTVAKLAHNCASFAIQALLAEIFTLGVKGGSSRSRYSARCARAHRDASALSIASPISFFPGATIRRRSRCASRTRTPRSRWSWRKRSACRCASARSRSRNSRKR